MQVTLKTKEPGEKLEPCMALRRKKTSVLGLAGFGPEDTKGVPHSFSCTYPWLSLHGHPETYGIKSHCIYVFVVLFQISTSRADLSVLLDCVPPGRDCQGGLPCPLRTAYLQLLFSFFEIPSELSRKFVLNLFSWGKDTGKVRGRTPLKKKIKKKCTC